ncbi:transcriptional regulator [Echinicola pacifica]|uniref:Transcriptional regulator n=1 Tax=Echinicola pacifica TaxID=346377 RepID=A0A918PNX2_9BACT|nr:AraC family transcriptional regulator [Echinicola pacifica]GGZ16141.1 transcriptional regulator [Echinicola pacifica]
MIFRGDTGEYFQMEEIQCNNSLGLNESMEHPLSVLWFTEDHCKVTVDAVPYTFNKNTLLFLTEFHKVDIKEVYSIKLLRFNRPFYCIKDHDSEVGCNGLLFFGASQVPYIEIPEERIRAFSLIWETMDMEMVYTDNLQLEMLQTVMKRLLILATRIFKKTHHLMDINPVKMDLVRNFCYLVEKHFKTEHSVAAYADMLFKSPKTISNVFRDMGTKSPLEYIHERIMIEARRHLRYTDTGISTIGYDLGFADIQTFSRFFKKKEGISPKEFREMEPKGNFANIIGSLHGT